MVRTIKDAIKECYEGAKRVKERFLGKVYWLFGWCFWYGLLPSV